MNRQYLVELRDRETGVTQKVWVITPRVDNLQEWFSQRQGNLPPGITDPVVVSVKEEHISRIRPDIIARVFPVLR